MVKASFEYQDGNKPYLILSLSGHAGMGDVGEDIVCAGVSTTVYTLAQMMIFMDNAGKLRKSPRIEIEGGEGKIVAKPKEEHIAETLHYFYMAYAGLTLLHNNYPGYVGDVPFAGLSPD